MNHLLLLTVVLISISAFADNSRTAVIECSYKLKKSSTFMIQIEDVLADKTNVLLIQKGLKPIKFHVAGNVGQPEDSYYQSDDKTFELGYVPYTTDYVEGRIGRDAFSCKSPTDGNQVISL